MDDSVPDELGNTDAELIMADEGIDTTADRLKLPDLGIETKANDIAADKQKREPAEVGKGCLEHPRRSLSLKKELAL